eukprot:1389828-Pyramimonas_sp.AAC.1
MKAAKRRFERFAKPLRRTRLRIHATICTPLSWKDKANAAERTKARLQWVSAERCQAQALARPMDNEGVDPAIAHRELDSL